MHIQVACHECNLFCNGIYNNKIFDSFRPVKFGPVFLYRYMAPVTQRSYKSKNIIRAISVIFENYFQAITST